MSANPIERVALDAIEFIEDLTADPLLDSEDVEMRLEDVQAHAGIEAASLRKRLSAALEAETSEGERLRAALVEAREALDQSYNVTTYPGDGTSKQDAAIRAIDAALIPAPVREGE